MQNAGGRFLWCGSLGWHLGWLHPILDANSRPCCCISDECSCIPALRQLKKIQVLGAPMTHMWDSCGVLGFGIQSNWALDLVGTWGVCYRIKDFSTSLCFFQGSEKKSIKYKNVQTNWAPKRKPVEVKLTLWETMTWSALVLSRNSLLFYSF